MERREFYSALLIISVFLMGNAEYACAQSVASFSTVDSDEFANAKQETFEQNNSDEVFTVNPYAIVEAEDFHEQSGTQIVANGNGVAYIENGDYLRFDNVEFDNGPIGGGIRASSANQGGTIEFRTGSLDGPIIATCNITNTGAWNQPQVFLFQILNSPGYADGSVYLGTQTLFMVFTGGNGFLMALDKFRFNEAQVPVEEIILSGCPEGDVFVGDLVDLQWQIDPEYPSVPATVFSVDNGDFIDPFLGEFTAQSVGEVTITITSISNPEVFAQCTFTVVDPDYFRVLVFHKTNGFRHGSIDAGIEMIEDFGLENDWFVENWQSSTIFTDANLSDVDVVVWLNTSGNELLTSAQQEAFENYIQNGGGFVGFHAATDTYRNGSWPWYNDLVGAIVQTGPNHTSNNFNATMDVVGSHPAVDHLGMEWNKNEEYYYWELNGGYIFDGNIDLLRVRSTGGQSYDAPRPITWYKEYDGGRSFYTALGHNGSDYNNNDDFRIMSEQAIRWAGGLIDIAPESGLADELDGNHESHDHGFVAYPNPANDLLTIRTEADQVMEVKLFSITGRLLKELNGKSGLTIDLSDLNRGLYLLQVNQGGEQSQVKIVKE
jgi:type 1 glutamine amidotransferase